MIFIPHHWLHSCQVSRNGRDSPGIWAYVPAASRLTQKAANVPEFLQTSTLEEQIWRLLSQEEFVSLSEAKIATHFNSKLLLVSIFGTAWLFATPINKLWPAGKWAGLANMGGANKFRGRENNCPGCLIQKLGNYVITNHATIILLSTCLHSIDQMSESHLIRFWKFPHCSSDNKTHFSMWLMKFIMPYKGTMPCI